MNYRIVQILHENIPNHRLEDYGGKEGTAYRESLEFPELRSNVEDEEDFFVITQHKDGTLDEYWPAAEFFFMTDVTRFSTED